MEYPFKASPPYGFCMETAAAKLKPLADSPTMVGDIDELASSLHVSPSDCGKGEAFTPEQ
jgi:hypothetical protein